MAFDLPERLLRATPRESEPGASVGLGAGMTSADDIDDQLAMTRAVKARAVRLGHGRNEVIEEPLGRDLDLEVLDQLWDRNDMTEESSLRLAVEAQHRTRPHRR